MVSWNLIKIIIIDFYCALDDWLLEDEKYILDELNGDCVCYLVDIMEYLMKGDEYQRRVVEEMFPEDPDVAKVMLKQVFAHSQYKREVQ